MGGVCEDWSEVGEKDGVLPVYFTVKLHFALHAALALTTLMGPTVKKVNGPNTEL